MFQLRGQFQVRPVKLGPSVPSQAVSPHQVFFANQSQNDAGSCENERCFQRFKFVNHGQDSCQAQVICTQLEGNVCGDYGVTLLRTGQVQEEIKHLCYEKELTSQTVSSQGSLEMIVWFLPGAEFIAQCYLWCTGDGELPSAKPESDDGLIEKLVAVVDCLPLKQSAHTSLLDRLTARQMFRKYH